MRLAGAVAVAAAVIMEVMMAMPLFVVADVNGA